MLFLGVDGGSTKTDFCLAEESGRQVCRSVSAGCNILQLGSGAFAAVMKEGLTALLRKADISLGSITAAHFGLTAFGEAEGSAEAIHTGLACLLGALPFTTGSDGEIALAASLGLAPGINVVAGTGSVAFGKDPAGRIARAGGWGCSFCDEGSAHWAARRAMGLFTKQADGRLPKTALYKLVRDRYALREDLHFAHAINVDFMNSAAEAARLQLVLAEALAAGDETAETVYRDGACELAALVQAVRGRLAFPEGSPVALSCSGGMFKNAAYLGWFRQALPGGAWRFCTPMAPPVAGALLLAAQNRAQSLVPESFLACFNNGEEQAS